MLYSTNETISANMDAYVGGVYLQETFDASTKTQSLNYIPAVQCSGTKDKIMCPATDSFIVEGGAESRFLTQNQSDFQYVVHSCTAMNNLRTTWG